MIRYVLGFRESGSKAKPECLYVGHDGDAAQEVLRNPPEGVLRTELATHAPLKRYFPSTSPAEAGKAHKALDEAPKPDPAPAEVEGAEEAPKPPRKAAKKGGK